MENTQNSKGQNNTRMLLTTYICPEQHYYGAGAFGYSPVRRNFYDLLDITDNQLHGMGLDITDNQLHGMGLDITDNQLHGMGLDITDNQLHGMGLDITDNQLHGMCERMH